MGIEWDINENIFSTMTWEDVCGKRISIHLAMS